jgi:hypothetical protein
MQRYCAACAPVPGMAISSRIEKVVMVQATTYEVFPLTRPAPVTTPAPLAERAQLATEASTARALRCASTRTRQHWVPRATVHLMGWLSAWARTQLTEEGPALTWERYARQQAPSTKRRATT